MMIAFRGEALRHDPPKQGLEADIGPTALRVLLTGVST